MRCEWREGLQSASSRLSAGMAGLAVSGGRSEFPVVPLEATLVKATLVCPSSHVKCCVIVCLLLGARIKVFSRQSPSCDSVIVASDALAIDFPHHSSKSQPPL